MNNVTSVITLVVLLNDVEHHLVSLCFQFLSSGVSVYSYLLLFSSTFHNSVLIQIIQLLTDGTDSVDAPNLNCCKSKIRSIRTGFFIDWSAQP